MKRPLLPLPLLPPVLSILLISPALQGCAARTWRFSFEPSPDEILIRPETEEGVRARALTTVLRGELERRSGDYELLLRLRIDNLGSETVTVEREGMRLVGSDLVDFGPPRIEPEPGDGIRPGTTRTFELRFPYPSGVSLSAPHLDGLHFGWTLSYPTGAADVSQSFSRRWPYEYDDGPRWSFFFSSGHYYCH